MSGRGPVPKPVGERRRRNVTAPTIVVTAGGEKHGPELPDTFEWPKATLEWWETWRSCAQASLFTPTDWSFLVDTAVLHGEFWSGNRNVAAELRLRVAKFGATPEDRARLRIDVGDGARPNPTGRLRTKVAIERRRRLLKAVEDSDG